MIILPMRREGQNIEPGRQLLENSMTPTLKDKPHPGTEAGAVAMVGDRTGDAGDEVMLDLEAGVHHVGPTPVDGGSASAAPGTSSDSAAAKPQRTKNGRVMAYS